MAVTLTSLTMPPILWTLIAYELILATGTVRTTIRREVDGDPIVKHQDVPQPQGDAWADADVCAAVEAHLPAGHTVAVATPVVDAEAKGAR